MRALRLFLICAATAIVAPLAASPPAAALLGGMAAATLPVEPPVDPFPLRRVLIPIGKAGDPATLMRLSREDFEARVRAAATASLERPPRLIAHHYTATLVDTHLAGRGEWTVAATAAGPVALEPLTLAVASPRWAGGDEAILYRNPATTLWVDRVARRTAAFDWSLRGIEEPGELRFDVRVPGAAVATLTLDLPAGRMPVPAQADVLLTGPTTSPVADHHRWRLAFGGKSRAEFVVRAAVARGTSLVHLTRIARYDPATATATFDFDFDALRGAAETLSFDVDPGLRVLEVTTPTRDPWKLTPGEDAAKPARVTVSLREPAMTGHVTIAASLAPPPAGEAWNPPAVRGLGPAGDDSLELRVGPDVKLESWEPNDYHLLRSLAGSDRGYTLVFKGGLAASGTAGRRSPTVRLRPAMPAIASTEALIWTIDTDRQTLSATLKVKVLHGPLAALAIRMPAGFQPTAVHQTPDDPAASWTNTGGGTWTLEPSRPWVVGPTVDVRLELRGPAPAVDSTGRAVLPFPKLMPAAATREGSLAVRFGSEWQGWATSTAESADGLAFRYTGTPDGTLTVARKVPSTRPAAAASAIATDAVWRFADLALETKIDDAGLATATFAGRVTANGGRTMPVVLPSEATLESCLVAGKWVDLPAREGPLNLPIPTAGPGGVAFELRYRLPNDGGRVTSPAPQLPGEDSPLRRTWTTSEQHRLLPALTVHSTSEADGIRVVPRSVPMLCGFALAASMAMMIQARRTAMILTLLVGIAAGLVPEGWRPVVVPPLAVLLFVLPLASRRTLANTPAIRSPAMSRLQPATTALVLLVGSLFGAEPTEPATVFILPGGSVLAPKTVLDQLATLTAGPRPPVVLSSAEYVGTEIEDSASITARFVAHVSREGPQTLLLPLAGMKLERVTADGAPAFPDLVGPDRYSLALSGLGSHVVVATFTVPIASAGADRELKFGVPDLPSATLAFTASATARQMTVPTRRGRLRTTRDLRGATVLADLGDGAAVIVRWRAGVPVARTATVTAREATVWDVTESEMVGTTAALLTIEQGALTRIAFEIPAGFDAGRPAVRPLDGTSSGIRDWRLAPGLDGSQALTISLQAPLESAAAVSFRLYPRRTASVSPILAAARCTTATTTTGRFVAIRAAGVTAERIDAANAVEIGGEALAKEFAGTPELAFEKRPPARAYKHAGGGLPELRPVLRSPPTPVPFVHELTWHLGPRATINGVVQVARDAGLPSSLEVPLPAGVTVTDVQAADLAGWSRSGAKLRVWFRTAVREPMVKWNGHWPAYPFAAAKPPASATVGLPAAPQAIVRVRPLAGWVLRASGTRWDIWPPGPPPTVRLMETVDRRGSEIVMSTQMEIDFSAGRPHQFVVRADGVPAGAAVTLDPPPGTSRGDAASRRWDCLVTPEADRPVRATVIVRLANTALPLPQIIVLCADILPAATTRTRLRDVAEEIAVPVVERDGESASPSHLPPATLRRWPTALFWAMGMAGLCAGAMLLPRLSPVWWIGGVCLGGLVGGWVCAGAAIGGGLIASQGNASD